MGSPGAVAGAYSKGDFLTKAIYAAIGNSAVVPNASLAFNAALVKGELSAREAEIIKLAGVLAPKDIVLKSK